jgi:hypothetical protein
MLLSEETTEISIMRGGKNKNGPEAVIPARLEDQKTKLVCGDDT